MSELVSVVMPAWRPRPEWLREAVASVLAERGCDLELLVVDDGSDPPVAPLLADLADERLRVLRVEHGGAYAARNAALREAAGAFVRYVDADDVAEPGSTAALLELARRHPGALAYGGTLLCDETLTPLEPRTVATSDLEGDVAAACVQGGFDVYVVSILFPRAVLERSGPWEEAGFAVSGDWDYVLRATEQAPVRRLDRVVTRYRRHARSLTKAAEVAAGARAARLVVDRYLDRHPEQRGTALARRAYGNVHADRVLAHAWAGERRAAARELGRAARRDPRTAAGLAARWARQEARRLRDAAATRARRRRPH
jgi:glycosyltransferase involved in cell wall biosynthesis